MASCSKFPLGTSSLAHLVETPTGRPLRDHSCHTTVQLFQMPGSTRLEQHVRFLNKLYQFLVASKMPQKVRKLVDAGPKDSSKTFWAAIFHRLVPAEAITTITKEQQFSVAMMNETTQLVTIDEWSASTMESDLAKILLQGGWMGTAVKHTQPCCFFNTCPFYITTNNVPDFGEEQENIERRLAIF